MSSEESVGFSLSALKCFRNSLYNLTDTLKCAQFGCLVLESYPIIFVNVLAHSENVKPQAEATLARVWIELSTFLRR